ncbi:alpha/beta hydrolase [Nocardioidaceae bacterium]|nr:alpha/beta hydrolase [Nocardioidaceae bacterium]
MSVQARMLGLSLRMTVRPFIAVWSRAPGLPWPYALADLGGLMTVPVKGTSFVSSRSGDVRVVDVVPAKRVHGRRILYFPGGAFLVGGQHLHRGLLAHVAHKTGARITAVGYRKMPRHPISASVADCLDAYRAAVEKGTDDLVVMGDSAGGFLTLAVLAAAQAEGLPMPAGAVTLSPLCEVRADQRDPRRTACAVFGPAAIPAMLRLADGIERARGSAGYAHPHELCAPDTPPILMQAARRESLFPEIKHLAQTLRDRGIDCELQAWDLDVHVFQAAPWVPEARDAVRTVAAFCDRAWAQARDAVRGEQIA